MNGRLMGLPILLSLMTLVVIGCANPQPLPMAPTAIPTLVPATLPPQPTNTPRPAALGVTFPSRRPSAPKAASLYQENCASCHGVDGKGQVPGARDLSDADYLRGETPLRFYQIITDGRGSMPSWRGKLSDDERWDLAFYIWTFATPPEMLTRGKQIFEQNCVTCHGPDGKGVVPGTPDFTNVEWMATKAPQEFFQVVTEGRGTMPSWQGRLSPDDRWAAIEYIRTFAYEPASAAGAATAKKPTATVPAKQPTATAAVTKATLPATYVQKGCVDCHGDKAQGLVGPILAGLPVEHIKETVRSGVPTAGMPAFDSNTLSDEELDALAQALHALTLKDTGVKLSQPVLTHLEKAWDALRAGDKAGVETHLKEAQKVAANAPQGVQVTLKVMLEGLREADWESHTEAHLKVLLGK